MADNVFRDSVMTNMVDLVEILPALNVTEDPELEEMCADVKAALTGYSVKDLRKDAKIRETAGTEAKRIMDTMKGYMSAMQGA